MAMIKLTKQRAAGEKTIYVNTDYIQAVRQHPNVRVGPSAYYGRYDGWGYKISSYGNC